MRKFFYLVFVPVAFFGACKKDDKVDPDCEKSRYGIVKIENTSSSPYKIYIDEAYQLEIGAKKSQELKIDAGYGRLSAEQASGYVLYPTKVNETFNIKACAEYTWRIP